MNRYKVLSVTDQLHFKIRSDTNGKLRKRAAIFIQRNEVTFSFFKQSNPRERLVKFGTCSEKCHLKVFPYILQCFVFGRYDHVTGAKNSHYNTIPKPNPIYYIFSE